MDDRIWHTTATAAEHVGCHPDTILKALTAKALHGTQRTKPHGRWRIHHTCLDAWAAGESCTHQQAAA